MASASARRMLPARRISCFRSQGAVFSDSDLRELEQTSSAKSEGLVGFGAAGGAHLVKVYFAASFCCLEGCFGSGEAADR